MVLTTILFAAQNSERKVEPTQPANIQGHVFKIPNVGHTPYNGSRSIPTVVDQIDLSPVNSTGYCWGITYDWERDCLWVTQWNSSYSYMYAIQKTSPCVKIDSVLLGSGVPAYRLGIGYAGGDVVYMAGYDGNVYQINLNTGTGTFYRSTGWPGDEGLGFNVVDDAIYIGDWNVNLIGYAQPAQTGSMNTWTVSSPSGMSGAHSAALSPQWLFTCNEDAAQAYFYQHSLTNGVPNMTPDSVWDLPAGMTQASTADCAFDGQYIYVLDQSGPDMIWVFDVGITTGPAGFWDFETGWQGWTHTNNDTFPFAWDVQPSGLHAIWTPPDAGDSCLWIDSDAAGIGPTVEDTAWSPVLVPLATMDWLIYGLGYNNLSATSDSLYVGIRTYTSGVWNPPVQLIRYSADFGPAWDSLDVSTYSTADLIQIYYYYSGSYDWYAAVDNISINARVAEHDVGCNAITSPPEGNMIPAGNYDVIGNIRNFGDFAETFDATAEVYDTTTWTQVFSYTVTLTAFAPDAESLVTFGNVALGEDLVYQTIIYTELTDDNPGNDTSMIYTNTTAFDFVWTFESGTPEGWTHTNGQTFPMGFGIQPSGLHATITPPDAGSYCGWWDSDAGGSSFWIRDTAKSIQIAPNSSTGWLKWGFGNYSTGGSYLNELHVGIKHFTGGTPTAVELTMYPSSGQSGPAWDSANVSAYNTADSLQIYFYFDDLNTWGWYAAIDNIMINGDSTGTGIAGGSNVNEPLTFGFAPTMATLNKGYVTISYTITAPGDVRLKVYDGAGRLVRTLVEARQSAGENLLVWDSKDINNRTIANGVYFLKLEAEGKVAIHKTIFVK